MKLRLGYRNGTKACYRFERRDEANNLITLYRKKTGVHEAGIDPKKGVDVTITEAK